MCRKCLNIKASIFRNILDISSGKSSSSVCENIHFATRAASESRNRLHRGTPNIGNWIVPGRNRSLMPGEHIECEDAFHKKRERSFFYARFEIPLLHLRISGIRLRFYPEKIDELYGKSHIEFWYKTVKYNRGDVFHS